MDRHGLSKTSHVSLCKADVFNIFKCSVGVVGFFGGLFGLSLFVCGVFGFFVVVVFFTMAFLVIMMHIFKYNYFPDPFDPLSAKVPMSFNIFVFLN